MSRKRNNNKNIIIIIAGILIIGAIVAVVQWVASLETWAKVLIIIAVIIAIVTPIVIKIIGTYKIKKIIEERKNKKRTYYNNSNRKKQYNTYQKNNTQETNNINKYEEKSSMTECELKFWNKLKALFENEYIITPQIPLNSIVKKNLDAYYANELNRTIDFGLFTKEDYKLVALIELNDRSHLERDRIERDKKVKQILTDAGLINKLITFWTDKPNTDEYVLKRVKEVG